MHRPALVVLVAAGLAATGGATASAAADREPRATVPILSSAFASPRIDVLQGDSVAWRNDSVLPHTVAAADGSWASQRLGPRAGFSHRFSSAGAVAYYCQVHPYMRGEVVVRRLLLTPPRDAAAPGRPLELTGRSALRAGSAVSIEADGVPVATATVGADGGFRATVTPRTTTTFRAVAAGESSQPVQVLVLDRQVEAAARTRNGRVVVGTRVVPASPRATVVLQLRLRERFGWWPVQRRRLDARSRAEFALRPRHAVRARVVLTGSDGATPLARSASLRLRPGR